MNIAVIPWNEEYLEDRLFWTEPWKHNVDNRLTPFAMMQREFERRGDSMHTIDLADVSRTDLFLFFEHNPSNMRWLLKLADLGLSDRAVYCNAEPPVVNPLNAPEGFRELKRYYPYLLTWNDDWIDGKRIFRRHIPYYFEKDPGDIPFGERKLLTSISGNKHSDHPLELYSERERVLTALEKCCPEEIDFYGTGWDASVHPCYGGRVKSKNDVFHHYRFALAFENTKNVKGYITEKILDCFAAGIVPVYKGAEDIADHIPPDCFIAYDQFDSPEEMVSYLRSVTKEQFEGYLDAAQRFWDSDAAKAFTGAAYAQDIYDLFSEHPMNGFTISRSGRHRLRREIRSWQMKQAVKKALGRA